MAERVGFEPTYRLLTDNSISSRARYGRTSLPLRTRGGDACVARRSVSTDRPERQTAGTPPKKECFHTRSRSRMQGVHAGRSYPRQAGGRFTIALMGALPGGACPKGSPSLGCAGCAPPRCVGCIREPRAPSRHASWMLCRGNTTHSMSWRNAMERGGRGTLPKREYSPGSMRSSPSRRWPTSVSRWRRASCAAERGPEACDGSPSR